MPDVDLSALASGPDPVLAQPSDVRARGDQRTRRTRVVIAGAAACVLLAGAGTAITLAGDRGPDALIPVTPTATTSPSAETPNPAAHLLTPQDAGTVAGGAWLADPVVEDLAIPLVACPTGDGYAGLGARRTLRHGTDHVLTDVVVQPEAIRWVGATRQEVLDCPRRAADSTDGKASDSFTLLSSKGAEDWVLVRDDYRDCDSCAVVVRAWLVVGVDQLLSYTSLPETELAHVDAWLGVVRERLGVMAQTPSASPTDSELSSDDPLQIDRIGPVRVGMTIAEARAAAGQPLVQQGDVLGNCVYYAPRSKSPDVYFMVIDGIVSRIDVDDASTTATQEGISIGASEADVKRTYPTTTVSKHYYTDGHYLRVLSADGKWAYLFETDGTKVINFRSGYPSAIDQVEGCA